ncbi:unnamed protein product [Closterium sp. Naga37s-1]|nr:unnamed protein product [Closterium sp. Naga37s-1]
MLIRPSRLIPLSVQEATPSLSPQTLFPPSSPSAFSDPSGLPVQIPLGVQDAKPLGRLSKRARLLYWLDNLFATEPNSKALTLLAICMLLTAVGGVLYKAAAVASNDDLPLGESVWVSWTFVSNPSEHVNEASGPKRVVSAVVSVGGMLFFALLVGLATDLVASKVDQLEQGNGAVIESNHTLVCGWTPKTIPLVKALVEAGERPSVVVVAERESVEMDGELVEAVPIKERGGMRVMTRRGDPLKAADLNRCSASRAASIVILSPQLASRQQADAQVLQTAMALAVLPEIQGDVVAELACPENTMLLGKLHASLMKRLDKARQQHMLGSSAEAARLVTHAGSAATAITTAPSPSAATATSATDATGAAGAVTSTTTPSSSIPTTNESTAAAASTTTGQARTASRGLSSSAGQRRRKLVPVETCGMALRRLVDLALQPAGSAVAAELLRFKGAEFHFKEWKELEGRTFAEAVFLFEEAVPCGVQQMVGTEDERTLINPPGDTVIEPGDRLLVIAESADSYAPRKPTAESAKEHELAEKRLASFATPWHYDSLPRGNVRRRHNVLIAGEWRDDVAEALLLLGSKLAPRSQVAVMVDSPSLSAAQQRLNPFMKSGSLNLNLSLYHGHLGCMADLERVPLEAFDTVIVLAPHSLQPSILPLHHGHLGSMADLEKVPLEAFDTTTGIWAQWPIWKRCLWRPLTLLSCSPLTHTTPNVFSSHPPSPTPSPARSDHGHLGSMADLEKVPLEAFDTVIVLAPRSHHKSPPDQPQQQMRDDEGGAERGEGTSSRGGSGGGGEGGEGVLMPSASVTAMMIRTIQRERGQATATVLAESDLAVEGRGEGGEEGGGEGEGEGEGGAGAAAVVDGDLMEEVRGRWLTDSLDTNVVHARILAQTAMDPGGWVGAAVLGRVVVEGDMMEEVRERRLTDSLDTIVVHARILAQTAMDPDVGGVLDEIVSGSGSSLSNVGGVLDEIVSGSGSSLSLEDATSFLVDGEALSFFDLQVDFIRFLLRRIFRMAVVAAAVTARSPSPASASGASAGWLWPLIGTAASIAFASAFSLTLRILRGLSASRTHALHPPQAILVLGGNRYRERLAGRFAALLAAPYQPVTGNLSSASSSSSNSGLTQDKSTGNRDFISSSGSGGGDSSSAAASGSNAAAAACLAFDPIVTSSPNPLANGTLDPLPPAHAAASGKLPVFISSGNDDAADVMMREGVAAGRLRVDNHALDTVTNFTTMLRTFQRLKITHVLVVTSDFHMPRAAMMAKIVLQTHGIAFSTVAGPSAQMTWIRGGPCALHPGNMASLSPLRPLSGFSQVAGPSSQMTWIRGGPCALDPVNITSAIDSSLQRLQCDYIDLLQLHWPDRYVPMFGDWEFDPRCDYNEYSSFEAQLEALGRAVEAGKVRYVGVSNETAWGLGKFMEAANKPASSHHATAPSSSSSSPLRPRPIALQNANSLLCRTFDSTLAVTPQTGLLLPAA